jgi:hypothetical protein
MKKVLLVVLVVVLMAATGLGAFYWQQQKIDDLNGQIDSLSNQATSLADENAGLQKAQRSSSTTSYKSDKGVEVIVTSPKGGAFVTSPLKVTGKIPGSWSFEAEFSVRLLDDNHKVLAQAPAKLQGDWMTDTMVPFSASLPFTKGTATKGSLVLVKANPSDLSANDDSVVIPVKF